VDDHVGFGVHSLALYHEYTSIWDGKLSLNARVRGSNARVVWYFEKWGWMVLVINGRAIVSAGWT